MALRNEIFQGYWFRTETFFWVVLRGIQFYLTTFLQFLCFVGLKKCLSKGLINLIFRIILLQHNCFSHCTMQSMYFLLAVSFAENICHLS